MPKAPDKLRCEMYLVSLLAKLHWKPGYKAEKVVGLINKYSKLCMFLKTIVCSN